MCWLCTGVHVVWAKCTDVFVNMLLGEVVVIGLNAEVFVYLGLLGSEETFNFLNARLLYKQLLVF